jgi:hypothetical protein
VTNATPPPGATSTAPGTPQRARDRCATATGRLRPSAAGAVPPALGGRCGRAPRRFESGRRGIPDGSVPIVMRAGSRRAGSVASVAATAAPPRRRAARRASSTAGSSSCQVSSPVGSLGASATSAAGTGSDANDDQTSTSSVGLSGCSAAGIFGGPHRWADRSSAAAIRSRRSRSSAVPGRRRRRTHRPAARWSRRTAARRTHRSNESISDSNGPGRRRRGRIGLVALTAVIAHVSDPSPSGRTSSSGAAAHTSSNSCSLRPNAASMCSTWSWVTFSSSFSARSRSSAEISPSFSARLHRLASVAASTANGDAAVLGHVLDHLDVLAAAFLGQLRQRQADRDAVVVGRHTEVAVADRLLDDSSVLRSCGLISN